MTPGILMLLGGGAIIIGIIGLVINFLLFTKRMSNFDVDGVRAFGFAMVLHILCGLFYGAGILSLIGGFIWFLVTVIKG